MARIRTATTEAADDSGEAPAAVGRLDLGPLPNFVGYLLRRAQLLVFDDFIRTMSSVGLRPASFSVLAVIGANPGSSQSAVSEVLGLQRTNLVAIIDSLEQGGFARRKAAKTDRRSHALYLTAEGKRLLSKALTLQAEHERRVLGRLSDDETQSLLRILTKLVDG